MAEIFPNLAIDINLKIQGEQTPHSIKPKDSVPKYSIVKLPKTKDKEKNLESSEKEMKYT